MATVWHYTDAKGDRVEEAFTDAQAAADANAVALFQRLESLVANDKDPNKDTGSVDSLRKLVADLPKQRKLYWAAEIARIGITAEKAAKPAAEGAK